MKLRTSRFRFVVIAIVAIVSIGLIALGIRFLNRPQRAAEDVETKEQTKPQAPPDLAKLRDKFTQGLEALQHNDGAEAVRLFSSFDFGSRAVEEYRLYFLANGHQLAGDRKSARATLARLWRREPHLVYANDAGLNLGSLYTSVADFAHSGDVYASVASRSDSPAVAAQARWEALQARFVEGDVAAVLEHAHNIAVKAPRANQAVAAIAIIRGITGVAPDAPIHLTPEQRLERGVSLLRDGDPQNAYDELTAFEPFAPASLKQAVQLNRGLALNQLRRFEDSNKALEPLGSSSYKVAIPALYYASRNYRTVSASINPIVIKTVVEKKQVGTVKVKQKAAKGKKARIVTKPKFANVKKNVQLIDLAKKAKKDEYDRLSTERLKDLLSLPISDPVRVEVLNTLIGLAEAKNQDAYEQDLVKQLVKLDPTQDPGLQHFWDKAWAAYARGDLNTAKPLLLFISETYANPNVKRQAQYWYARTIERAGSKAEAAALYRNLASAPYDDIYALNAEHRGYARHPSSVNPVTMARADWPDLAEKNMPAELRLGYELTALSDMRDAQLEITRNMNLKNAPFANALLADLYHSFGKAEDFYKTVRKAFPQLATVEQDSVPPYFLKMYYPVKYEAEIKKYAKRFGVDPYIVMGLCLQESYYNARAKSPVGATGLMQIMPATGKELGRQLHPIFNVSRLENPETNIEIGTFHFSHLQQLFQNNPQLAIAAYNAGQGNVLKWRRGAPGKPMDEFLESIPYAETRNYVKRVTLLSSSYRRFAQ